VDTFINSLKGVIQRQKCGSVLSAYCYARQYEKGLPVKQQKGHCAGSSSKELSE
jgi:hypothetical protein